MTALNFEVRSFEKSRGVFLFNVSAKQIEAFHAKFSATNSYSQRVTFNSKEHCGVSKSLSDMGTSERQGISKKIFQGKLCLSCGKSVNFQPKFRKREKNNNNQRLNTGKPNVLRYGDGVGCDEQD